jgi:hypothetical protein
MKAIYKYTLMGLLGATLLTGCSDEQLDTTPSTSVATEKMTGTAASAIAAVDGMYRLLYTYGYTSSWETEEFGLASINLAADLMGEDHIMAAAGSGWFWYDYLYGVKGDFGNNAGRPYGVWNFFYTLIANANYVIAAENTMEGDPSDVKYVVGQAYAIRAYSYFMLAQWYSRTYVGHESEPCVPIYTEPTTKDTQGKPRETVAKVYQQIDSDIAKAEELLSATEHDRNSKSHMDLATTYGIHTRVAQVEEKWNDVLTYSSKAITEAKKQKIDITEVSQFAGLNKVSSSNVMWGVNIIADQTTGYASFFTHMDADLGKYGASARQQITKSLYAKMGANDARRAWWNPADSHNGSNGYQQEKFKFVNYATWEGDYIFMRVEEMYLAKAEAECMLGLDGTAQQTLKSLMDKRDPDYTCTKTGTALGATSDLVTGSLREEIINQRRIELWGEFGRIYDLRRLHQGFVRSTADGHPDDAADYNAETADPESYKWVMVIPQSEFDGNANMDASKDQNPFD